MTGAYVALTRLCISAFDLSPVLPDFLSPRESAVGGVFLVGALAQLAFVVAATLAGVPEFRPSVAGSLRPSTRQAWIVALVAAAIQCAAIALFFIPEPLRIFEPSGRNFLLSLLPVTDGWTQEVVFRGYLMLRLAKAGLPVWGRMGTRTFSRKSTCPRHPADMEKHGLPHRHDRFSPAGACIFAPPGAVSRFP